MSRERRRRPSFHEMHRIRCLLFCLCCHFLLLCCSAHGPQITQPIYWRWKNAQLLIVRHFDGARSARKDQTVSRKERPGWHSRKRTDNIAEEGNKPFLPFPLARLILLTPSSSAFRQLGEWSYWRTQWMGCVKNLGLVTQYVTTQPKEAARHEADVCVCVVCVCGGCVSVLNLFW